MFCEEAAMEDERKTKKQLIEELHELRQCVAKLQGFEEEINQTRANLEKYTKVFLQNSIPMAISTAKEGRFVDVNNSFLRLVGLKREKVIGHTSRETGFITEEQRSLFYNELGKEGNVENLEFEVQPKGRGVRHGLFSFVMMTFSSENYLLTSIQDITDRKIAEKSLRDSEKTFRLLFDSGNDYIAVHLVGKDGQPKNFIHVNDAACEILGYTREEMLKLSPKDVDTANSSGKMPEIIEKLLKNKHVLFKTEMIPKDGNRIPMEVSVTLFQLGEGQATMCVARDITERKNTEEALAKSEKKYRMISEAIGDCVFLMDKDNIIKHVTHSREILGYELEEMIGASGFNFLHPDDLERMTRLYHEGIEQVWNENKYQNRLLHKDGHYVLMEMNVRTFNDPQGKFMAGVFVGRDITSHSKKAKEPLLASKSPFIDRRLTLRENEILRWVMEGKSTWDISKIIKISESTVKFHIENLMKKLSAVNRTQAVAIAIHEGLINQN